MVLKWIINEEFQNNLLTVNYQMFVMSSYIIFKVTLNTLVFLAGFILTEYFFKTLTFFFLFVLTFYQFVMKHEINQ